jgi:hypothetical protein
MKTWNAFQLALTDKPPIGRRVSFSLRGKTIEGPLTKAAYSAFGNYTHLWVDGRKYVLTNLTLVEVS